MSLKRHKPWLPMEENRCKGHRGDDKRLRGDCKTCIRRIANRGNALYWIQPAAQVDGVCPNADADKAMNTLPNDIARCGGVGSDEEGWREGCDTCLRRTAPQPNIVTWIAPPPIIAFECEYLIEPE